MPDKTDSPDQEKQKNPLNRVHEITTDLAVDYTEVLIDTLTDSDILKEIPLVKSAVAAYSLLNTVKNKRFSKRLQLFIVEVRERRVSEEKVQEFKKQFDQDKDYKEQVLEHIIDQIERADDNYKAKILARLYVAFVNTEIEWRRFLDLSYALDRAHTIALERLAIQDEYTIPPNKLTPSAIHQGIPIQADMKAAVLLEGCGLAFRPQIPPEGGTNILLTDLGVDMLIFGVKPDGPWKRT